MKSPRPSESAPAAAESGAETDRDKTGERERAKRLTGVVLYTVRASFAFQRAGIGLLPFNTPEPRRATVRATHPRTTYERTVAMYPIQGPERSRSSALSLT